MLWMIPFVFADESPIVGGSQTSDFDQVGAVVAYSQSQGSKAY